MVETLLPKTLLDHCSYFSFYKNYLWARSSKQEARSFFSNGNVSLPSSVFSLLDNTHSIS